MSVEKMIKTAQDQCNITCYVWGAKGQDMASMEDPEAWVKKMEKAGKDYTLNCQKIMARYNKLVAQGINPIRAFDCSGLVWYCLNKAGYDYKRTSAKYYFAMCKEIGKADLQKGDFVFHDSNGTITHIGIYVGDGMCIHSKGRSYGVVEEPMSVYGNWNRFGYLDDVREDPTPTPEPSEDAYIYFKGSFSVRAEPTKESERIGIVHKGQSLTWTGDAENGWHEVDFGGEVGFVTGEAKYQSYMEFHSEEAF